MKFRLYHDGGAVREATFEGFDGQSRTLLRFSGLYEFSLVHGYGLRSVHRWHIHQDDLEKLRIMARDQGLRFREGRQPTRPDRARPVTRPEGEGSQVELFE